MQHCRARWQGEARVRTCPTDDLADSVTGAAGGAVNTGAAGGLGTALANAAATVLLAGALVDLLLLPAPPSCAMPPFPMPLPVGAGVVDTPLPPPVQPPWNDV